MMKSGKKRKLEATGSDPGPPGTFFSKKRPLPSRGASPCLMTGRRVAGDTECGQVFLAFGNTCICVLCRLRHVATDSGHANGMPRAVSVEKCAACEHARVQPVQLVCMPHFPVPNARLLTFTFMYMCACSSTCCSTRRWLVKG